MTEIKHTATSTFNVHREGDDLYVECKPNLHHNRVGKHSLETYQKLTAWELFERRCKELPNDPILSYKDKQKDGKVDPKQPFKWYNGKEAMERGIDISNGIKKQFNLKKGDMVGIFFPNRADWVIINTCMHRIGLIPIPLYATLGIKSLNYILDLTNISLIFVASETISKVEELHSTHSKLDFVYLDPIVEYSFQNQNDFNIVSIDEIIKIGKENKFENDLPTPDDTYSIFFTSGTSGVPKGVVQTHKAFHSSVQIYGALSFYDKDEVCYNHCHYCYLPFAHVYQHEIGYTYIYGGGRVAFNAAGLGCLLSEIQEVNPDLLVAVPRILQRFKMAIDAYIASTNFISRMITPPSTLFGKNLKVMINGSAPVTPELYKFFRENLPSVNVVQGYGLTETFAAVVCGAPGLNDLNILSIGSPLLGCTFRMRNVPDMGYLTTNNPPSGELEIKSPNMFKEYYKMPELTQQVFTEDGFFISGDIIQLNTDASVSIIDRRSNLIKLAQGEFVAVETLEFAMVSKYIAQAFISAISTDNFITSVVVPTAEGCKLSEEELLKEITKHLQEKGFASFSIPKAIFIEHTPFSEENDLMTPTMKLRRADLRKRYAKEIEMMRNKVNGMA